MAQVTMHAYKRLKERTNIKGLTCNKDVERAWVKGKKISECPEYMHSYLANVLKASTASTNEIRYFGGNVFIFNSIGTLITVFPLRKQVKERKQRRIHIIYDAEYNY